MIYHQRDIVEIDFPIPGECFKVHPALIVSNDELQVNEGNSVEFFLFMLCVVWGN